MIVNQSTTIDEGAICFEFGDRWSVCKYDEHPAYRNGIERLNETKAVDFIGILDDTLYFIEVKDFRAHRIENKPRIKSGELWIEVGQKVRDSLAGVLGAYRVSGADPEFWENISNCLHDKERDIKIVLWLEEDGPAVAVQQKQRSRLSVYTNKLKKNLRWLTTRVFICNAQSNSLNNLQTRNPPRNQGET